MQRRESLIATAESGLENKDLVDHGDGEERNRYPAQRQPDRDRMRLPPAVLHRGAGDYGQDGPEAQSGEPTQGWTENRSCLFAGQCAEELWGRERSESHGAADPDRQPGGVKEMEQQVRPVRQGG